MIVFDIATPLALYYGLRAVGVSNVNALLVGTVPGLISAAISIARRRRTDLLAALRHGDRHTLDRGPVGTDELAVQRLSVGHRRRGGEDGENGDHDGEQASDDGMSQRSHLPSSPGRESGQSVTTCWTPEPTTLLASGRP